MREYTNKARYVATILTALSLSGCSEESPLEQTVRAQQTGLAVSGTVRGGRLASPEPKREEELDLSTPEKAVEYFNRAYADIDYNLILNVTDGPFYEVFKKIDQEVFKKFMKEDKHPELGYPRNEFTINGTIFTDQDTALVKYTLNGEQFSLRTKKNKNEWRVYSESNGDTR